MRIGDFYLHPISDGTFAARPRYFGNHLAPDSHPELFNRHHTAWLPIGCFLVRTSNRLMLIDAGLGPELRELPHGMHLVGGQLPTGLRALGVAAADITDVICSHLHADHVGWLFDPHSSPVFPQATIWLGTADWHHFVTGTGQMLAYIREGFRAPIHAPRLRPIDHDTTIAPGVTALLAPRTHTRPPMRSDLVRPGTRLAPRGRHHLPRPARRADVALHGRRRPRAGRPYPGTPVA